MIKRMKDEAEIVSATGRALWSAPAASGAVSTGTGDSFVAANQRGAAADRVAVEGRTLLPQA